MNTHRKFPVYIYRLPIASHCISPKSKIVGSNLGACFYSHEVDVFFGTNQTDWINTSCGHSKRVMTLLVTWILHAKFQPFYWFMVVKRSSCGSLLADMKFSPPIIPSQNSSNELNLRFFVSINCM